MSSPPCQKHGGDTSPPSPRDLRPWWGVQGHMLAALRKFRKCGAVWCVLVYIFRLCLEKVLKGTDQAGTFMSLKYVVYYANYRSWHQSSKIQVDS